jgi:hypothetical protein
MRTDLRKEGIEQPEAISSRSPLQRLGRLPFDLHALRPILDPTALRIASQKGQSDLSQVRAQLSQVREPAL